jgi:hypothetical protein
VKPRRTQRALYRSKEPFAFSLCLKIYFSVITFALEGCGTKSQVWFACKASYSSIARHQLGSANALRIKDDSGESTEEEDVVRTRRSKGHRTPTARWVTIRWMCLGSWWRATRWYTESSSREGAGAMLVDVNGVHEARRKRPPRWMTMGPRVATCVTLGPREVV